MRFLYAAAAVLIAAPALAQTSPGLVHGQVPNAAQWNSYFSGKADTIGGVLTTPTFNGVATFNGAVNGTGAFSVPLSLSTSTATGSTTERTQASRAADFQDVRNWFTGTAASCATNVASAVDAAVAAGVRRLYIPANCTYKPTGNVTPADTTLIGEDRQTSIISVANRATNNLTAGPRSSFENMGIISKFCDEQAPPLLTAKVCPVGKVYINSDTPTPVYTYAYNNLWSVSGPTVTGPTGSASATGDLPGFSSTVFGSGADAFYAQTGGGAGAYAASGASGMRIVTSGDNDIGLFVLNGYEAPVTTSSHHGIWIDERTNNGTFTNASMRIHRYGNGTDVSGSIVIDDVSPLGTPTFTRPLIDLSMAHQGSGNAINIFQTTTAYSGDFILVNAGNSSGTFSGNFFDFQQLGVSQIKGKSNGGLDLLGNVTLTGATSRLLFTGASTPWSIDVSTNLLNIHNNANSAEAIYMNHSSGTLRFDTGAVERLTVNSNGAVDVTGTTLRVLTSHTPATSSETCTAGSINWDTGFVYVCTSANTWKRSALSAF